MKCIKRWLYYPLILSLIIVPSVGYTLDLTIEPRVQAGIMDYQFEQKPAALGGSSKSKDHGFKLVSSMPFVGIGTTLFLSQFFLDVYGQKAFSGSDSATNKLEDEEVSFDFIVDSDIEREEYSVSVGYTLGSQWALFGGYRAAKTQFNNSDIYREVVAKDALLVANSKYSPSFKQNGFFFGGAYAFPVLKHAVVTFNVAFAILEGKYDSRNTLSIQGVDSEGELLLDPDDGTPIFDDTVKRGVDHSGDTVGLNFGASWKGRIGERVGYSLGINGYSYDFDNKSGDEGKFLADLSESVLRFSGGLSYQF